jgi:hypothetical protein
MALVDQTLGKLATCGYSDCRNTSVLLGSDGSDEVRVSGPSLPSSRSGPAVKGGPTGPSEASREAAPWTAGQRRLREQNYPGTRRRAAGSAPGGAVSLPGRRPALSAQCLRPSGSALVCPPDLDVALGDTVAARTNEPEPVPLRVS